MIDADNCSEPYLAFLRHRYEGDLKAYISQARKHLQEIASLKIEVPQYLLSITILSKLSEELYSFVDT